jgi:hypothetical protein
MGGGPNYSNIIRAVEDKAPIGGLGVTIGLSATVGLPQYFVADHLRAARFMAELCQRRQDDLVKTGTLGIDPEIRSFALAAITESAALLEAAVNEVWQQAADFPLGSPRIAGLDPRANELLSELGRNTRVTRSLSTLERYDLTLVCTGQSRMDTGRTPGQDVLQLMRARNALIHFKPELHMEDEVHDLEKTIKHVVPASPLLDGIGPWFPHQLLTAGVAQWAWEKSVAFEREWRQALGITYDPTVYGHSYWNKNAR